MSDHRKLKSVAVGTRHKNKAGCSFRVTRYDSAIKVVSFLMRVVTEK